MGRSPACSPQEKARIILEVLADRMTLAEAAAAAGVSTTSIGNWKRQFLLAAGAGLTGPSRLVRADSAALQAENDRLHQQVRDALVVAKVWQMSALAKHNEPQGARMGAGANVGK
ncbi:MAG TPA: transposase [Actinocrinis sp.]|nr:transposase [Actinocrinis sp.]